VQKAGDIGETIPKPREDAQVDHFHALRRRNNG